MIKEKAEDGATHWVQDKWEKAMHQGDHASDTVQDKACARPLVFARGGAAARERPLLLLFRFFFFLCSFS